MDKGFVIVTHYVTGEQQTKIKDMLKGLAWWHHLPQAWLVIDESGKLTCAALRDKIAAGVPGETFYIFEVPVGGDWAGYGPTSTSEWLDSQWKESD